MRRLKVITFMLALFMAACASPDENTDAQQTNSNANASAAQQAATPPQNDNSTTAQPNAAAPNGQPAGPLPAVKSTDIAASPEAKAGQVDLTGPLPKLELASREINFGTQKRDKTLNHTIRIKNGGKADLKIESVVPG
jgi:hypothetical protein